jgi:hypothetical protein
VHPQPHADCAVPPVFVFQLVPFQAFFLMASGLLTLRLAVFRTGAAWLTNEGAVGPSPAKDESWPLSEKRCMSLQPRT